MTRTTLICDRCKTEATTVEERTELELGCVKLGFTMGYSYGRGAAPVSEAHHLWSQEWCAKCRKELGIYTVAGPLPKECVPPTLEDMIREIVREELPYEQ